MIKCKYVPYNIALELRELGFVTETFAYYLRNLTTGEHIDTPTRTLKFEENWNGTLPTRVSAPLWMEAMDFLRDKFNIDLYLVNECSPNESYGFEGRIKVIMSYPVISAEVFPDNVGDEFDYYKVLELTILKAIEIAKFKDKATGIKITEIKSGELIITENGSKN